MLLHFFTHITYIVITTLLGAMFPFFGDILELGAALIVFPFNFGLVHHMYLKVGYLSESKPHDKITSSPFQHFNPPNFKIINKVLV
jgi:hypothetical protein